MRLVLSLRALLAAGLGALALLGADAARGQCGAIELAAGRGFSVAVRDDGTAWSWGAPWVRGGVPSLLDLSQATQVAGLDGLADIAAGEQHALALRADGSAWGWGDGTSGQLGAAADGSWADEPVVIAGVAGAQALAAGRAHSLALLDDGTVLAWGDNSRGQLGDGTFVSSSTPVPVRGLAAITAVASGMDHCLALDASGVVFAWGAGDAGALGNGSRADEAAPIVVSSLAPMSLVAAGGAHSLAADAAGAAWSWGSNELGQLGHSWIGSTFDLPDQVPGLAGIVQLSGGEAHSLALLSDGTVLAWGSNREGNLGSTTPDAHLVPVTIAVAPPAALVAGATHSLGLMPDGGIASWGSDFMGELGAPPDLLRDAPVQVLPAGASIVALAGSREDQSFAISSTGEMIAWGDASHGELGAGLVATLSPRPFTIPGVTSAQRVASGKDHSLVLLADSTVLVTGRNDDGQLGDGSGMQQGDPVLLGLNGITAIAAGSSHSLAAASDGSVLAWGANYAGQLGDGTRTSQPMPALVSGLASIEEVAAGAAHSLARDAGGRVFAWGANDVGQLGMGDVTPRLVPAEVTPARGSRALACGRHHSLALLADGSVLAWGDADSGQVGVTSPQVLSPVVVPGLPAVSAIAAGDDFSLAMTASGEVFTWGALPPGSAAPASPRRVSGLPAVIAIAAGARHALALAGGDVAWAWGANERGQLGIGTGAVSQTPQDPGFARAVTDFTGTLRARKAAGGVELRWQAIASAVTYVVRRDLSPRFLAATEAGRVTTPPLTDAPPSAALWCYRVTGVDCAGNEGP